ncbi:MAG: preprotein translocase subunit SecE [Candidatus Saccharimonadales bacterium]
MADKKPVPAKSKRSQTVRERSQTAVTESTGRRVRKAATSSVTKPISAAGKGVKTAAKPFKPLTKPFQNKFMRKVGHILATVLLINYLRSSWKELRQVTWPNRKETTKLTIAVFLFAIVFGAIIAITDFGLDKIFKKILLS